ncbi:MAG: hypothetical protein GXY20_08060 [Clostridiales bacterium]|nr:hypothetical protein [Clostridiales bacterium]
MLKYIGAITVVFCCALMGIKAAGEYRARTRCLRGLIGALELMREEISCMLTPMPELLEIICKQYTGPVANLFKICLESMSKDYGKGFSEAWNTALSLSQGLHLYTDETETLRALAPHLGRYDGDGQAKALSRAACYLSTKLDTAEREKSSNSRICTAIGVGGGIMLAIILI